MLLQPTAQCPRKTNVEIFDSVNLDTAKVDEDIVAGDVTSQFGLGGFNFEEVFNQQNNDVNFQCSKICDGLTEGVNGSYGTEDSGYCDGPFACNVQSCTMISEMDENRVFRACPVELPFWNQSFYESLVGYESKAMTYVNTFNDARAQECQSCETCGTPPGTRNVLGFGRGCA